MAGLESDYVTPTITRLAYDINSNIEYIGKAASGSATSSSVWQITNLVYDVDQNITQVIYASGTKLFDKIWDNRASYSYS